jgi:hypothetical protein
MRPRYLPTQTRSSERSLSNSCGPISARASHARRGGVIHDQLCLGQRIVVRGTRLGHAVCDLVVITPSIAVVAAVQPAGSEPDWHQ